MQVIYRVESWLEGDDVAALIAIEQSAGRSRAWEGISEESRAVGRADVIQVLETQPMPYALPVWTSPAPLGTRRRAYEICVRYRNWIPACGIGNLLNVALGEPQHLNVVLALRLEKILWDPEELAAFPGPTGGSSAMAPESDLVVAPIKPSAGLSPEEAGKLAYEAAMGGADVIKDDELAFPGLRGSWEEHCACIASAVRRSEQETGTRKQYWANLITSPGRALRDVPRFEVAGVDAFIVAPAIQGADICSDLREVTGRYLVAHNTTVTTSTRVEGFGIALSVWMQLQRLAGADALLAPSPYGTFGINPTESQDCLASVNAPLDGKRPALLCHSGGVSPANVRQLKALAPNERVAFTAGSAIFDHPHGARAGAAALKNAVTAISTGNGGV
jgi:ribulose 1,5-bisphosphate carboxylase large subunit-like protein